MGHSMEMQRGTYDRLAAETLADRDHVWLTYLAPSCAISRQKCGCLEKPASAIVIYTRVLSR